MGHEWYLFILRFCTFCLVFFFISCLLQYCLPGVGVIVRVIPAHLHGADQGVLSKHLRAEPTIHVSTFLQREMGQAQHEGEDGTFTGA